MLDISRIESGRVNMRIELVDYAKVVREAMATLAREAESKGIRLQSEVPESLPRVRGDADRIAQVLINLLSNGIKYTPRGGWVTLSVEPGEALLTTCIADNGVGIKAEDQQRLFQKFFRADNSTTREVGGTGLGLAITRAILEKLNGSIWVESAPGEGSRFCFTLPLAETSADDAPDSAPPQGLILTIDDDPAIVRLITHHLSRRGFATVGASSGAEGLRRAQELLPDAITLDLMMPGQDGFSVLRALHEDKRTVHIPVVIVSILAGERGSEVRDAFAFLSKPIDSDRLLETVRKAIAGHLHHPTVLIVGSDEISDCLRDHLAESEARLLTTADEAEAERLAAEAPPDLVLLDAATPGANATRLVHAIHSRAATAHVPFVVITEEDVCREGVVHLATLGQGPVALDKLADAVGNMITRREDNSSLPLPPAAATLI